MKLTVFKSRRGRPSQFLQQALQLSSLRLPLSDMVQNNGDSKPTAPEVAKQNALGETVTADEMKENLNVLQQREPVASAHSSGSTSPEKAYIGMDNGSSHGYVTSTPVSTRYDTSSMDNAAPRSTALPSPATPSFSDKDGTRISNASSSGSEADMSRSPMSLCCDSSVENSPDGSSGVPAAEQAASRPVVRASPITGPVDTSTPLHPPAPAPAPVRRRPGRPPGSTKKRVQSYAEYKKRGDANAQSADDFSLRKFFEAGGRDYNEYLEWLKKRQAHQSTSVAIVGQVSSFPTLPAAALPGAQTSHTQHLTCVPSSQFPARTTTMYSSAKSPVVLPPPPYRPMLVPRTTALPPGVRLDAVPVTVSVPHVHTYPYMAPSSISPTHLPPPPPSSLQDSNALDLSAPTRKRKSEGSNSSGSEEDLPFPTSHSSSKLYRDNSGSPLELLPQSRSPHHLPSSTAALSPHHKPDINGNVTGGGSTADASDFVESTTEADISSWDTESVVGFINTIPGCQEYSEVFREHRIDGATLPHLSEEHLLNLVKMKLGPAIRLRLAIARLRPSAAQ